MPNIFLRLPSVQARTGLSRSTIYLRISEGSFPKPVSLGSRAVGWLEDEIEAWVDGGLCPFHADRSPGSWKVNTDTGAYRCLSCGAGGPDVIAFAMDRYDLSFPKALRRLAEEWWGTA